MIKKKILALLISLGVVSSPALAAEKFLNNDLNMSNRFKKQEPKSGAEQFREDTGMDPVAAFFLYAQCMRELIGYGNGYKFSGDKANIGYAVKKICEYNSKEARKERLRQKISDIIYKSGLKEKLGKEGRVGKLLRAEMRDQNFVDFFNCVNEKYEKISELENIINKPDLKIKLRGLDEEGKVELLKKELGGQRIVDLFDHVKKEIDYELATPKILSEEVVDEMLAVTSMTDKEKNFIKSNVNFYLYAEGANNLLSFKILGFLKSYNFLESYKRNPLIIQDVSASTPYEWRREINDNEVACAYFSDGQLMDGDYYTQQYEIKPLKILKKVNGKLVLEDENE